MSSAWTCRSRSSAAWSLCCSGLLLLGSLARADEGSPCAQHAELAKRFSKIETMRSRYREDKTLNMLEEPLVSEGRMFYQRPDRIHQAIEKPSVQKVTISGGKITIEHPGLKHRETLDLTANQTAETIVRSILEVMSGKVTVLADKYECTVIERKDRLDLDLKPRLEPLSKLIARIEVTLSNDLTVRTVKLTETGGDHSLLTFSEVVYDKPFTAKELETYFAP